MVNRFRTVERVLLEEMAKPYKYGQADCFVLGCRMVDALDDAAGMADRYAGAYRTLLGAQRALRKRGFKTLSALFQSHLEPCAPAEAAMGDVGILLLGRGEHVGVCVGGAFVTKTETGQLRTDLASAISAFRTGARR